MARRIIRKAMNTVEVLVDGPALINGLLLTPTENFTVMSTFHDSLIADNPKFDIQTGGVLARQRLGSNTIVMDIPFDVENGLTVESNGEVIVSVFVRRG